MWNCSTVSCSAVLLGNFLDIGCAAILEYDSKRSSDLVPSAQNNFIEKVVPRASGSLESPDVFEPKPCSHGPCGPSSVGRVTPCAPFVNGNRRAEDCPPYQVGPATGRWLQVRGCYESLPLRFLYLCPLEDDLDLDEEVEEERR